MLGKRSISVMFVLIASVTPIFLNNAHASSMGACFCNASNDNVTLQTVIRFYPGNTAATVDQTVAPSQCLTYGTGYVNNKVKISNTYFGSLAIRDQIFTNTVTIFYGKDRNRSPISKISAGLAQGCYLVAFPDMSGSN